MGSRMARAKAMSEPKKAFPASLKTRLETSFLFRCLRSMAKAISLPAMRPKKTQVVLMGSFSGQGTAIPILANNLGM